MLHVKELLAHDSFAAVESIHTGGEPLEIAARYAALVSDFYWKARDLPVVVLLGRAGILYCLAQSLAPDQSPESVEKLRSIAKGLAYDVGSFTWSGWDEPGINPTADQLEVGRDCARLNLRLAIELNKPADRLSMAHWLVGAHALSAKDFYAAEDAFRMAIQALPADHVLQPLNNGHLAIAQLCADPTNMTAKSSFDQITQQLAAKGDEDSKAYLTQLQTVRRIYQ